MMSNLKRVKSCDRLVRNGNKMKHVGDVILKPFGGSVKGYSLYKDGIRKWYMSDDLYEMTFCYKLF